jgi:hypothetical protein
VCRTVGRSNARSRPTTEAEISFVVSQFTIPLLDEDAKIQRVVAKGGHVELFVEEDHIIDFTQEALMDVRLTGGKLEYDNVYLNITNEIKVYIYNTTTGAEEIVSPAFFRDGQLQRSDIISNKYYIKGADFEIGQSVAFSFVDKYNNVLASGNITKESVE